jgi:hypothetical protein
LKQAEQVAGRLDGALRHEGYAFVGAAEARALAERQGSLADWDEFAASWNDLYLDLHMADGGRYRRRRHAVFTLAADGAIRREPHQPHWQGVEYNPLNGGVQRWFEPVTEDAGSSASLRSLLGLCGAVFGKLAPQVPAWRVEMHQFRIEARPDVAGQPTPEGLHRDGVDWVLVLLVRRENVERGETNITDLQRSLVSSFTLAEPMDAALVDDSRVFHGVTPIRPMDPSRPSFRDVLVVTFRRE